MLNQISWMIAAEVKGEERDLAVALKAASRAAELTEEKNGSVLDTLARVYYEQGNLQEAIEWQKKAAAASPDMKPIAETLKKYEAEANPEKDAKPAEEKPAEAPAAKPAEEKEPETNKPQATNESKEEPAAESQESAATESPVADQKPVEE